MVSLRDLGSMNGTHINGKKCGGREKGETPEQGALRQYPSIDLKNRDRMPGLEKNLAAIIDKALVRNPKDRFPDAGKLQASLLKLKP